MLILNIGMARKSLPNTTAARVVAELFHAGFQVQAHAVFQSDTEPTVVAIVKPVDFMQDERLFSVAIELGQDCIAVYDLDLAKGRLIGPKADEWGEFNGDYFIKFDGGRLSTPVFPAAA